jgi:hypothetical protein
LLSEENLASEITLLDDYEIPPNDSIFVVETNKAKEELDGRTLCAIESDAWTSSPLSAGLRSKHCGTGAKCSRIHQLS